MSFKVDFKRFKKVGSDKNTTTLRHPSGHSITIAHNALSPKMRSELHALPHYDEGGSIPGGSGSPAIDPDKAKQVEKGATESGWQPETWKKNIKEGLGLAGGTPNAPVSSSNGPMEQLTYDNEEDKPKEAFHPDPDTMENEDDEMYVKRKAAKRQTIQHMADGGDVNAQYAAQKAQAVADADKQSVIHKGMFDDYAKSAVQGFAGSIAPAEAPIARSAAWLAESGAPQVIQEAVQAGQGLAGKAARYPFNITAADVAPAAQKAAGMFEGGDVSPDTQDDAPKPPQSSSSGGSPVSAIMKLAPLLANKGGKVNRVHYDDGTPNAPVSSADAPQGPMEQTSYANPSDKPQAPVVVNVNGGGGQQSQDQPLTAQDIGYHVGNAVKEGIAGAIGGVKAVGEPILNAGKGLLKGVSGQPNIPDSDDSDQPRAPSSTPLAATAPAPANPEMALQNQPQQPNQMDQYGNNMQSGYNLQVQGANEQMKGQQTLAERQEENSREAAANTQNQLQTTQDVQSAAQNERSNLIDDIKQGYIKPQHLFDQMSTPGKIGTAVGILLSGFGSGITGGPNLAMDFLNKQIDRDIEAQRVNLGAKENLLSNNLSNFKNINDAMLLTRMQYNDYYSHLINQYAAQNNSAQAKAARDMAVGHLQQQNAFFLSQMGKTSGSGQTGQPSEEAQYQQRLQMLRYMNPKMASEEESRYIPWVGRTNIPLDAKTRATITERNILGGNIQQLAQFQQKYGGTLEGIADPRIRAQGEALAKQVQDQYRRANDQGVFKPAEAHFVSGVIGDNPSSLFSKYTKLPAYRTAAQINQNILNETYKSVGMHPFKTPAAQKYSSQSFKPAG